MISDEKDCIERAKSLEETEKDIKLSDFVKFAILDP